MLLKRIRMASFWGISQVCFELLSFGGREGNWIGELELELGLGLDWEIEAGN